MMQHITFLDGQMGTKTSSYVATSRVRPYIRLQLWMGPGPTGVGLWVNRPQAHCQPLVNPNTVAVTLTGASGDCWCSSCEWIGVQHTRSKSYGLLISSDLTQCKFAAITMAYLKKFAFIATYFDDPLFLPLLIFRKAVKTYLLRWRASDFVAISAHRYATMHHVSLFVYKRSGVSPRFRISWIFAKNSECDVMWCDV